MEKFFYYLGIFIGLIFWYSLFILLITIPIYFLWNNLIIELDFLPKLSFLTIFKILLMIKIFSILFFDVFSYLNSFNKIYEENKNKNNNK